MNSKANAALPFFLRHTAFPFDVPPPSFLAPCHGASGVFPHLFSFFLCVVLVFAGLRCVSNGGLPDCSNSIKVF